MPYVNPALEPLPYTLNLVGEEGAECAKEVNKIFRFGLFDVNPFTKATNLQSLQNEITDLIAVVRLVNLELVKSGLPPLVIDDEAGIAKKIEKVLYFAERSLERGTLAKPLALMTNVRPDH